MAGRKSKSGQGRTKDSRRANGEGSIYAYRNGYAGQVSYLDPVSGTKKRRTVYGKNPKEVQEKMRKLKSLQDKGRLTAPSKLTVKEWVEAWLNDYMKLQLKPSTFDSYKSLIELHINPQLGEFKIITLQTNDLQKYYNHKAKTGRKDEKGGLSPRSIRHIHAVLHKAFDQAVIEGIIPRNPTDSVSLPRLERTEIKPLTTEQVSEFLNCIKDDWLYPLFLVELGTGLRRGEILALQWEDVNLKEKTIRVRRSMVLVRGTIIIQENTKTKSGERTIDLPEQLAKELKRMHTKLKEEKLAEGVNYQPAGHVFRWQDGRPIRPDYCIHHFKKLLKKHKLPNVRFHDLRHTYATMLLEAGEHPKVVSELLGHSTITITLDTYSHVMPSMKAKAAARLDELISAPEQGIMKAKNE